MSPTGPAGSPRISRLVHSRIRVAHSRKENHDMKHQMGTLVLSVLATALAAGCASAAPPEAKLASSAAAIRAAQELHATEEPTAQLRLQYAQDEYAEAQRAMGTGDNERAERYFSRAEADAELAVAIAKQVRAERAFYAAQAEVAKVNSK
jgi:hypothetical protein